MRKTKLSGILDNSSTGVTLSGAEISLGGKKKKQLIRAIKGSNIMEVVGDLNTNGTFKLAVADTSVIYQLRTQGGNTFLNATGNPTKLMSGDNDIPVLLKDKVYANNSVANTMSYALRIMLIILEEIPGFDFSWKNEDGSDSPERIAIRKGNFNITRLQFAWYSGDLGENRDEVLLFLRKSFNGQNATKTRAVNLASDIGVNVTAWDNHSGNLTFSRKAGDKQDFSLTLYSKDEEPEIERGVEAKARLQSLIRFDVTFFDYFLVTHGIKKVYELEKKFRDLCDADGYDIGFIKWLAEYVFSKLKLKYVVGLDVFDYRDMLEKAEVLAVNKRKMNESRLIRHWLAFDKDKEGVLLKFDSAKEKCEAIGANANNYSRYVDAIRKDTGIDIDITRSFHEGMLLNRVIATLTEEERTEFLMDMKESNFRKTMAELQKRDASDVKKMQPLITVGGLIRIRKLKPVILKSSNFWAYKKLRGEL